MYSRCNWRKTFCIPSDTGWTGRRPPRLQDYGNEDRILKKTGNTNNPTGQGDRADENDIGEDTHYDSFGCFPDWEKIIYII